MAPRDCTECRFWEEGERSWFCAIGATAKPQKCEKMAEAREYHQRSHVSEMRMDIREEWLLCLELKRRGF